MVFEIDGRRFFQEDLKDNIDDQISRVAHDYASALIMDGGVGKGKTCCAVQCADYISLMKEQRLIDLDLQLARGYEEFFSKLDYSIREKRSVLIYDEAGDFSKKGTLTKINLMLNRVFEQYRQFHIIVILCLPLADSLDNSILHNEIPRMILHIDKRHHNRVEGRAYSLKRFFMIKHTMSKLAQKSLAYSSYACNFHFRIYPLPPEREALVVKYSLTGKKAQIKGAIITSQGLLSYSDLAKKTGRSLVWVRMKLLAEKYKAVKTFDRKKYFDSGAVDFLLDKIER